VFKEHIGDPTGILERNDAFKGIIRYNAKNRNRAYVTVEGINVDVKVEGAK